MPAFAPLLAIGAFSHQSSKNYNPNWGKRKHSSRVATKTFTLFVALRWFRLAIGVTQGFSRGDAIAYALLELA